MPAAEHSWVMACVLAETAVLPPADGDGPSHLGGPCVILIDHGAAPDESRSKSCGVSSAKHRIHCSIVLTVAAPSPPLGLQMV